MVLSETQEFLSPQDESLPSCNSQLHEKLNAIPSIPKIAVVVSPFEGYKNQRVFPSGALYVTAAFRSGFPDSEVQFIDAHNHRESPNRQALTPEEVFEQIKDADIVPISVNIFAFPFVEKLVRLLHAHDPRKLILVGGSLPGAIPDIFLENLPGVDIVFIAEAEKSIADFGRMIAGGAARNITTLDGISYRGADGNMIHRKPKALDLTTDGVLLSFEDISPYGGAVSIASHRGCESACYYCGVRNGPAKRLRNFSPDQFREQLEIMAQIADGPVPISENQFFSGNMEDINTKISILGKLHRENGLTWSIVTTPYPDILTSERLAELHDNGCVEINLHLSNIGAPAHTTGNLFSRRLKDASLEYYLGIVQTIRDAGIKSISALFNLGLPGETVQSLQDVVKFALKAEVHIPNPRARWYPGSVLWNRGISGESFDPLKYLRGGFADYLFRLAGMQPLTAERIREETEYSLCEPGLRRRLVLAIRYLQEISSALASGSSPYISSVTEFPPEITDIVGEKKKLIASDQPIVLKDKSGYKLSIQELPFSYHYLMSHYLEYRQAASEKYSMQRAIMDLVTDYLYFIGSDDEFVTDENIQQLSQFIHENLGRQS